jgi:hypothetical protein
MFQHTFLWHNKNLFLWYIFRNISVLDQDPEPMTTGSAPTDISYPELKHCSKRDGSPPDKVKSDTLFVRADESNVPTRSGAQAL